MTKPSMESLQAIEPGETSVFSLEMKADQIEQFGNAIGNHHVIHMDPDWIDRETPWGNKRVMHGLMTMSLVSRPISNFLERHGLTGCIMYNQEKLVAPVRVGDTVTITLTYKGLVPGKPRLRFDVEARNQKNETVMVGECHEHVFL